MKPRTSLLLVLLLTVAVSLGAAQTSDQCKAQTASDKGSCCMHSAKATMTSNSQTPAASEAKMVTVSDKNAKNCSAKNCTMKSAKNTTQTSKASCPMMTSGKGTCKDPSKCTGAKASTTKPKTEKSDYVKGAE